MKLVLGSMIFMFCFSFSNAQDVVGIWKTIDDNTGEAKSHIEIFKKDGKVYGKIIKILNPDARDRVCSECEGEDKNVKILGMNIIKGLKKDGNEYSGGTITDPENGKIYKSKIWLTEDNPNRLKVRGYVAFLYRTQEWIRLE